MFPERRKFTDSSVGRAKRKIRLIYELCVRERDRRRDIYSDSFSLSMCVSSKESFVFEFLT